jgi:hypothetical protein
MFAMQLSPPLFALILVLIPMIFLASIAAIFDEITVITKLQCDVINCGDATASTYFICCLQLLYFICAHSRSSVLPLLLSADGNLSHQLLKLRCSTNFGRFVAWSLSLSRWCLHARNHAKNQHQTDNKQGITIAFRNALLKVTYDVYPIFKHSLVLLAFHFSLFTEACFSSQAKPIIIMGGGGWYYVPKVRQ